MTLPNSNVVPITGAFSANRQNTIAGEKPKFERRKLVVSLSPSHDANILAGRLSKFYTGDNDRNIFWCSNTLMGEYNDRGSDGTVTRWAEPITRAGLTDIANAHFRLVRVSKDKEFDIDVSKDVFDYLCDPQSNARSRFVHANGVKRGPIIHTDGTVFNQRGHDPVSGMWCPEPSAKPFDVPREPDRFDAECALAVLRELLVGFPFVGKTGDELTVYEGVAIAGMLTALVRTALPTAPMFATTATAPGSGKTALSELIAKFSLAAFSPMAHGDSYPEFEKRVNNALTTGQPIVYVDNAAIPIGGANLDTILTSERTDIRVLGRNDKKNVVTTRALFIVNGNALRIMGDTVRRTLAIKLDPGCEDPHKLDRGRDPRDVFDDSPMLYVGAAATILRAWAVAEAKGEVVSSIRFGSYLEMQQRILKAVQWLGYPDPVTSQDAFKERDPIAQNHADLVAAWSRELGDGEYSMAELIELYRFGAIADRIGSDEAPDTREALGPYLAPSGQVLPSTRAGQMFAAITDRVVDGMKLAKVWPKVKGRAATYRVAPKGWDAPRGWAETKKG